MTRGWHRPGFPVGTQFHDLTIIGERQVIELFDKPKRYVYPCRCRCGTEVVVSNTALRNTKTCGCLRKTLLPTRNWRHGDSKSRLYYVWCSMRNRCTNPKRHNSHRYIARGIIVCPEWANNYIAFRDWAHAHGYCPGLQLDRINNDGGYDPDNCRWVSSQQNNNNRANNVHIEAFGESKSVSAWARDPRCHVSDSTILHRVRRLGWSPEDAIMIPSRGIVSTRPATDHTLSY